MTENSEQVLSAENARKAWVDETYGRIRVSQSIIRTHEEIIRPLSKKIKEFEVADFCSWVIKEYPQVHFLTLNLAYREIEIEEIYDANREEIDDPDGVILEAIADYVNEHYYRHDFQDLDWGRIDIDMLDLYTISQWRP